METSLDVADAFLRDYFADKFEGQKPVNLKAVDAAEYFGFIVKRSTRQGDGVRVITQGAEDRYYELTEIGKRRIANMAPVRSDHQ